VAYERVKPTYHQYDRLSSPHHRLPKLPLQVACAGMLAELWASAARQEKKHPICPLLFKIINILGNPKKYNFLLCLIYRVLSYLFVSIKANGCWIILS
jgi:hypothetical protein